MNGRLFHRFFAPLLLGTFALLAIPRVSAQLPAPTGEGWQYTLLNGSSLLDECLICGRPSFFLPMHGTFTLRLLSEDPLSSTYRLENIDFTAGEDYRVTGEGDYVVGGEVAVLQTLKLHVQIQKAGGNVDALLESEPGSPTRLWPMLFAEAKQTNGTFVQTFTLDLATAPLRDLWFSTLHGMTGGRDPKNPVKISDGDLLSTAGHVVRTQQQLRGASGIPPADPDLGLDSASVLPGGRVAFSTRDSAAKLRDGDWVDDAGQVLARYEELLAPFSIMPIVPAVGLKTVQQFDSGETWFSIRDDVFSEGLSRTLGHGDVLSSNGTVAKDHSELLARFNPPFRKQDYGLSSLFVWPTGEIWFSVQESFQDDNLGAIQPGDLLSDSGYIVFRNRDLVQALSPFEDLADFGLDSLFVISDASPPAPPSTITGFGPNPDGPGWLLTWKGSNRVVQILRSTEVAGPYLPLLPIMPGQSQVLPFPTPDETHFYLRLRQW